VGICIFVYDTASPGGQKLTLTAFHNSTLGKLSVSHAHIEIAKVQSTEASNEIEGIRTTNTRLLQLVKDKTTPRNRDEEEIMGYRDVLNTIHENFEYIPITSNYIS